MMSVMIAIHVLAAVIWIGGMFFAHFMLRPSALQTLSPPQRLPLWQAVFKRFFVWVWLASTLLPVSGYVIIYQVWGGLAPAYTHIMALIGLIMLAIFIFIYFKPYAAFDEAVTQKDFATAATHLETMRRLITTNLHLGLVTVIIATAGKYLGF